MKIEINLILLIVILVKNNLLNVIIGTFIAIKGYISSLRVESALISLIAICALSPTISGSAIVLSVGRQISTHLVG